MKINIVYSAVSTWVTIPFWLIVISIWTLIRGDEINTMAVVPFIGLLLTLGFPFALYVSFILAPSLNQLTKPRSHSMLVIIVAHVISLICLYPLYRLINIDTFEGSKLLIFPFYLLFFFTPPSFVGCIVYYLLSEKDSL